MGPITDASLHGMKRSKQKEQNLSHAMYRHSHDSKGIPPLAVFVQPYSPRSFMIDPKNISVITTIDERMRVRSLIQFKFTLRTVKMFPLFFGTELHHAVSEACTKGDHTCVEALLDQIRSFKEACRMQNADGLTPIQLALSLQPEGALAGEMLHVECENLSPVESFKEFILRGNLQLVQMVADQVREQIGHVGMLAEVTAAFAELRIRNVRLSAEIVDWVQCLLVEADYQRGLSSAEDNRMGEQEREWRLRHMIECIEFLEKHHRGGGCRLGDMGERFLLYVQQIFEHVFFLKSWLKGVPLMQLQFCLSMFLGTVTGGRNEEVDIFGFMIDKGMMGYRVDLVEETFTLLPLSGSRYCNQLPFFVEDCVGRILGCDNPDCSEAV